MNSDLVPIESLSIAETVQAFGRYRITKPIETTSRDNEARPMYHFRVAVIDARTSEVVREFRASDMDRVRVAFRAVDEMLHWLKNVAADSIF
jgi:hypothetical protein